VGSRVIAIDGPAGSGKSTTAGAVADELGFAHLDSGSLYRAVTLAMLDGGVRERGDTVVGLARSLPVRLALAGHEFRPEVAGVDVSEPIRGPRVTLRVSSVAALPAVREWVTEEVRKAAALHPVGVVVDGRDIGTVVFPDAPLKVFLTASAEERARRRARQSGEDAISNLVQVQADLTRRDTADASRAVAPLKRARDAVVLDTTQMTFEEQVAAIVGLARKTFS